MEEWLIQHAAVRQPKRGLIVIVLLHALALAAGGWLGWKAGLATMLAAHAILLGAVFPPRCALYLPVIGRLPTRERVVWLTLDDGPSDETEAVLDLLDAHRARATFFVVGERALAKPELVREILRRGHELGNHSFSHPEKWFWALGPRRMREEITRTQAALAQITGTAPRWFRSVVGMTNPWVAAPLAELGLVRVAWSARGYDGSDADAQAVVARVERALAPGAIVLGHEGAAHGGNLSTLKLLLERLDALGYRPVLPSQLDASGALVDGDAVQAGRVATTSQLLNGVLPDSGENSAARPAAANRAASASRSG